MDTMPIRIRNVEYLIPSRLGAHIRRQRATTVPNIGDRIKLDGEATRPVVKVSYVVTQPGTAPLVELGAAR